MYCNHRYHQHHRHRHPCRAHDRITCTMPLSARLIASLSQCSAGCTCVVRPGFLFFLLSFFFVLRSSFFHLPFILVLYPPPDLCLVLSLPRTHSHRLQALHHHRPPDRSRYRHASSSSAVKSFHHPFSASSRPRFIILLFHHIILLACLLLIYVESSWFVLLQPSALTVCSALTALPAVD